MLWPTLDDIIFSFWTTIDTYFCCYNIVYFLLKDGFKKKFRSGEWIGLYQLKTRDNGTVVEPDDHDILHRTCYKQVTATDRENGWIAWDR